MNKKGIIILVALLSIISLIILFIVFIGISGTGIYIFSKSHDAVKNVDLSQQEIDLFNSKFENYAGPYQKGSNIKALIQTISSSNQSVSNKISITYNGTEYKDANISSLSNQISTSSSYNVKINKDSSGYVNKIEIEN